MHAECFRIFENVSVCQNVIFLKVVFQIHFKLFSHLRHTYFWVKIGWVPPYLAVFRHCTAGMLQILKIVKPKSKVPKSRQKGLKSQTL